MPKTNLRFEIVKRRVHKAAHQGIDLTMKQAVHTSQSVSPRKTGRLIRSTRIIQKATRKGHEIFGKWGGVFYGAFVKNKPFKLAAKHNHPMLAKNIKAALKRLPKSR